MLGSPSNIYHQQLHCESLFSKAVEDCSGVSSPNVDNPVPKEQLRPISVLPVLSKVFKKLVGIQMTNYVDHAHLLYDCISAFRKGHSTTTALMGVRDDIRYAMKRKEVTLMVLADFSKAFDTISFSATIVKFYKLGFSKPFLKWLLSYLSGRSQFVQIDDRKSSYQSSQYGVPQGSILGPMIFNLSTRGHSSPIYTAENFLVRLG